MLWEKGSGFDIVFKQQHLEGCFKGIRFLNTGKEDAQGKQQIHSGGLGQFCTHSPCLAVEFSVNISKMQLANMCLLNEVGLHYLILHDPFTDFIQQSSEDIFIFNHVRNLTYSNDCATIKSKNKND